MPDERPDHLHSLDITRGVAALVVVLWHWHHFFMMGQKIDPSFVVDMQPLYGLLQFCYLHGYEAVSLFFSLSGFIFFRLFAQHVADGSLTMRTFFLHRFSRLYPLHFATLLIVAALQPLYHMEHGSYFVFAWNDMRHFVLNVLLMSHLGQGNGMSFNGPSWSVSVELFLYAVFFLSCATLKPRFPMMLAIALGGYLLLGQFKISLGTAVGAFFIGGCTSVLYDRLTRDRAQRRYAAVVFCVLVACGVALFVDSHSTSRLVPHVVKPGDEPDVLTVVVFPCLILAMALAEFLRPSAFARLAQRTRLGELSYSVYMIHFPLQLALVLLLGRSHVDSSVFYSPLTLIAFLVVLIPLGLLSHYRFEMPVQRWLRARYGAAKPE